MPKAFVTGATGFVGGAVLRELIDRGWDARVLVRGSSNRYHLEGIRRPFETCIGDLRDRDSLRRGLRGCDVIFHVAARYSLWQRRPAEIYADNVYGTRNLLEAAAGAGVSKVVYTSTVGVLKACGPDRLSDESSVASLSEMRGHYKRSKWQAEQCALGFAQRGLPLVIVKPSAPVGPGDVKPTPTGKMILDFLNGRMFAYTDTGINLVAVEDVAVGHLLAAERGVPGESYILGYENLSLRRILEMLSELTGIALPRLRIPRWMLVPIATLMEGVSTLTHREPMISSEAARMAQRYMYFDTTKARRELGFRPGDVGEALARAIRWFCENGYVEAGRRAMLLTSSRRVPVGSEKPC